MSLAVNTQLELTLNAIMLPQLPPELTDRIIDFLWDDPAALHSCSLTARSWLSSSRFHLFSTLRIVNRRAYDRLAHLVINLPHMRHSVPTVFASRMPGLQTIRIVSADWHASPPHGTFFMMLSHFASVTQVEFDTCAFRNFNDFQRVVCAFPRLVHLFVRGDALFTFPPAQVAQAQGLWLREPWYREHIALWKWLRMTPSSRTITSLCISCPGTRWHAAFGEILEALGPSLERLEMPLITDEDVCSLAANSNLRQLVINSSNVQPWPESWAGFTSMLSQISSAQMRRLIFNLTVYNDPENVKMMDEEYAEMTEVWDDIPFERLNTIIAEDVLANMESVYIRLGWHIWASPFRQSVEFQRFQHDMKTRLLRLLWHSRGMLNVSHGIPIGEVYDFDFKQYPIQV